MRPQDPEHLLDIMFAAGIADVVGQINSPSAVHDGLIKPLPASGGPS